MILSLVSTSAFAADFTKFKVQNGEVSLDGANPGTATVAWVGTDAQEIYSVEGLWSTTETGGTSYLALTAISSEVVTFAGMNYVDASTGKVYWVDSTMSAPGEVTNGKALLKATYQVAAGTPAGTYTVTYSSQFLSGDDGDPDGRAEVITAKITVTRPSASVDVESVTLDKTELTLAVDGSAALKATVLPAEATDKTVTWTTSNANVATVDNGNVTAVGVGTATITATAGGKTATCNVTVVNCLHTDKTHVEAKAATCVTRGMEEHWKCNNCGALFAKENDTEPTTETALVIPKKDHTLTAHPAKAATCTEKGNIAYYSCSGCGMNYDDKGEVIKESVELPALGHQSPNKWESDKDGHWMTCQRPGCGARINEAAHEEIHEATCMTGAFCRTCGYKMADVNPDNHVTTGTKVWTKTPTTHTQVWSCCGKVEVKATAHTWNDGVCTVCEYQCEHPTTETVNAVAPSHKDGTPGYTGDTVCTVCRVTLKTGTTLPADQHVWEWVNSDETQHWQRCTVEGCTATQNTGNHEYKEVVDTKYLKSEATCTAKAVYYKSCVCGKVSSETFETGTTLAHDLKYIPAVDPTCTKPGVKAYYKCNDCGAMFSDGEGKNKVENQAELTIPALDHDWAKAWTTDGTNHWHKCTRCDAISGSTAHTSDKAENKANCQHAAKCDVCGVTYGELGAHDLKPVAEKPSTCKVNGTGAYYKCDVCGKLFSDADGKTAITAPAVLPLAEHTLDKAWHANASGHYHECTVCGTAGTVNAHTPGDAATEDTAQTCTECGYIITPATNHGDKHVKDDSKWVSDATSHWHACSGCSQQLDKANHTVTNWTVDKEATTSAEGLRHGNCSVCGHVVYETIAKINNGGHGGGGNGGSGSKNDSTKKDDGKKVESGRTFDAGIAMYVGLSVLSVTGGALVIGKKKERF